MTVTDQDLIDLSLRLWSEPGLLKEQSHSDGTLFFSDEVAATEFQFFMPKDSEKLLSPESLKEIREFYAAKGHSASIYATGKLREQLVENKADILFTEVLMKAETGVALEKIKAPASASLSFKRHADFKDADYRSVYNDVFVTNNENTSYEQLYTVMADTLDKAARADLSYKPHVVVGYNKNGEAVSMTTLIVKDGVAGIYNVGTKESARGKGYAAETMREAFKYAAELGAKELFLLTSSESELEKTYSRMGFSPFARYSLLKI